MGKFRLHPQLSVLFWLGVTGAPMVMAAPSEFEDLFRLDLQALSKLPVSSVSNTEEAQRDAPATTIVLTRDDLVHRGYRNLTQIFDDLPGMDVVRPYGDVYYANYWRGIRNNLGSPFLYLMDGVVQNDLYYNSAETLVALPISAVERIEVVYGPASVVYGANAFAGVVNIITARGGTSDVPNEAAIHSRGEIKAGSFDTRIADVYTRADSELGFASVGARYDVGVVDTRYTDDYAWTQDRYYGDPALWGGFANHSDYGEFHSAHRNTSVDLRVGRGDTVLVAQQQLIVSGYGTEYPGDRAQNQATWRKKAEMVYLSHAQSFTPTVSGKTLLAYRTSGLDKPSDFLEAFNAGSGDNIQRLLAYSLWNIENESTQFQQDLAWKFDDQWQFNGGLKAEWKHLQKAANVGYGAFVTPDAADPATYAYPDWPHQDTVSDNNENTQERSLYALTTWRVPLVWLDVDTHLLNAGVRVDDHSIFGSETSMRGGWVSHYGDFTLKLMALGESYQTPTPRVLYSGWAGSGSSPDLEPETANTREMSLEYTRPMFLWLVSIYQMDSRNAIINFPSGADNAGKARFTGIDLHYQYRFELSGGEWLRFWSYYSFLDVEETSNVPEGWRYSPFADVSDHKLHVGLDWPLAERWHLSTRARYFSARDTVPTNPVGQVKSYSTLDSSLTYSFNSRAFKNSVFKNNALKNSALTGGDDVQVALTVENLFGKRYFHPGVRQADAGTGEGGFDAQGVWQGSAGYFNSLLAQEGRGVFVSLRWDR